MSQTNKLIRLFESKYHFVLAVARRYAPAPDLAYDIVQQTFIRFIEAVQKYDWSLDQDMSPLLYEMTKNLAINQLKNESRRKSVEWQLFQESLVRPLQSHHFSEEEEYQRQRIEALRGCLEKQSPKSRALIEKHYVQQISMENIAKEENCIANTIRQTFCRIRKKLRECMENKNNE